MGKYAADPTQLVIVTDVGTYLSGFLGLTNVVTVDKFGPGAVVLTGQLAAYRGVPIIVSASAPKTEADGKVSTTAGNNTLVGSLTLPGTTASNTVAEASAAYYFENGALDLEAGWKIYVGLATTVSAGWRVSVIGGGDY
jgi:hypothetical protein